MFYSWLYLVIEVTYSGHITSQTTLKTSLNKRKGDTKRCLVKASIRYYLTACVILWTLDGHDTLRTGCVFLSKETKYFSTVNSTQNNNLNWTRLKHHTSRNFLCTRDQASKNQRPHTSTVRKKTKNYRNDNIMGSTWIAAKVLYQRNV